MATYTDNYQLTLPGYADVADVADLNHNMTIIDEIMHGSQVSLAPGYDSTQTYNTGDVVMYGYKMYKCITDGVTGAWDPTEWERTTAAETGGGEIDFDLYGEASGNPASFADGSESALVECKFDYEPKQDLHGYSKPWAGGGGKNKLDPDYKDVTTTNVTFYKNNGLTLPAGTYTASYKGTNNLSAIVIKEYPSNTEIAVGYTVKTVTFTLTASTALWVDYYNIPSFDDTSTNLFQLEIGSTATDYEPYSNICPIEGHDDITINVSPTNDTSQGVDTTIQLGDTYYGGTLNVGKGELVIDRELITLDGSSDEGWFKSSLMSCDIFCYNDSSRTFNNNDTLLNEFGFVNQSNYNQIGYAWWDSAGAQLRIGFSTYNTTDLTAFKTWLGNNPIQITGFLATPITVQLTPTVINTLLGQNYISSDDTENIDVVYTKSTAPIKPNPSGEADGYLSSIELNGEKFVIIKELPTFPTSDGDYKLKLSVSSGVPTLSWVSDT